MRKKRERKYRTHPLVGAALALSLLLTAAVCAASYGFYLYVERENEAALKMRERCAYEAYLSLCENLGRREMRAAAEALSRCELFGGCAEADGLRAAILSGSVTDETAEALRGALDGGATIFEAVRRADEAAGRALPESGTAGARDGMWATLRGQDEIGEAEAHRLAAGFVGGGVSLTAAESRTFPPVYTFLCKNASADITKAGGRLLTMYVYRHGSAEVRGRESCLSAAKKFLGGAGISRAELVSEAAEADGYTYVFCGTFRLADETVLCTDETVTVGVCARGGGVRFFDAAGYYMYRPASYDVSGVKIGRNEAARMLGTDAEYLTPIYSGGRLFWRLSGVKTLLCDAETGEIRVQNPSK